MRRNAHFTPCSRTVIWLWLIRKPELTMSRTPGVRSSHCGLAGSRPEMVNKSRPSNPSTALYDAVGVLVAETTMPQLMADSATRDFVADAFAHSKFKFKISPARRQQSSSAVSSLSSNDPRLGRPCQPPFGVAFKAGGCPFVLAEQQRNLERLGVKEIVPSEDFWQQLNQRRSVLAIPVLQRPY